VKPGEKEKWITGRPGSDLVEIHFDLLLFSRILSHNPLSVIDDTSFFQLPAVSYL